MSGILNIRRPIKCGLILIKPSRGLVGSRGQRSLGIFAREHVHRVKS